MDIIYDVNKLLHVFISVSIVSIFCQFGLIVISDALEVTSTDISKNVLYPLYLLSAGIFLEFRNTFYV